MKLLSVVVAMMVLLVALSAPAQVPAGQPPQSTPPPAQLPFPAGATHAYIDLARVAAESVDGQAANQKVQALSDQKVQVLEGRTVELQGSQQKLQQNANVMSAEAQLQLQREIDRLTIDIQRMTQDAETEVADLQQSLQLDFQQKLVPAIERVAVSKGLRFIFSAGDGGLIWAAQELDISTDVIAELDKPSQETP